MLLLDDGDRYTTYTAAATTTAQVSPRQWRGWMTPPMHSHPAHWVSKQASGRAFWRKPPVQQRQVVLQAVTSNPLSPPVVVRPWVVTP